MTGTLASLRDWIRDQVHEIQHLTVVAVLAPTKCAPVGHVADEHLPNPDAVPTCEEVDEPCPAEAVLAMGIAHHPTVGTCAARTWLLCDRHADITRASARRWARTGGRCLCGDLIVEFEQLVVSEARL